MYFFEVKELNNENFSKSIEKVLKDVDYRTQMKIAMQKEDTKASATMIYNEIKEMLK